MPFPGRGEMEVLWAHMNDEPPAASTVNPALPSELDAVTAKALSKEPTERYVSGSELVNAIRDATTTKRTVGRGMLAAAAGTVAVIIAAAIAAAVLLTGGSDGGAAAPDPDTSTITTIAGTGEPGYSGDGGPATEAEIGETDSIVFDTDGNLYFSDFTYNRIRKIDTDGVITTVAGGGDSSEEGIPATETHVSAPTSLAFDATGNLYFSEHGSDRIRRVDPDGVTTTVAGGEPSIGIPAAAGLATEAELANPAMDISPDGVLFVADTQNNRILRVDPDGTYATVPGTGLPGFSGDGGPAAEAELAAPASIAVGPDGSVYFGDQLGRRLRKIDPNGIITTVAGTGVRGFSGDGGPSTSAKIIEVLGIEVDRNGNVYFSDAEFNEAFGNRIRRIDTNGIITTVAGTGEPGFRGDGGPATEAQLHRPFGVGVDPVGNLYILDNLNYRIRKVAFEAN